MTPQRATDVERRKGCISSSQRAWVVLSYSTAWSMAEKRWRNLKVLCTTAQVAEPSEWAVARGKVREEAEDYETAIMELRFDSDTSWGRCRSALHRSSPRVGLHLEEEGSYSHRCG